MALGLPLIAFDQWLKCLISRAVSLNEDLALRSGFIDLIHVRNPGVAFGFIPQLSADMRPWFFLCLTAVALTCIIALLWSAAHKSRLVRATIIFVTAGAFSNLIDRFRFGAVVDYITIRFDGHMLPAFNFADVYIVLGLCGLIAHIIEEEKGAD